MSLGAKHKRINFVWFHLLAKLNYASIDIYSGGNCIREGNEVISTKSGWDAECSVIGQEGSTVSQLGDDSKSVSSIIIEQAVILCFVIWFSVYRSNT